MAFVAWSRGLGKRTDWPVDLRIGLDMLCAVAKEFAL